MKRPSRVAPTPDATQGHYYYISGHGEVIYTTCLPTKFEAPVNLSDAIGATQLPRPSSPYRGADSSPTTLPSPQVEHVEERYSTPDLPAANTGKSPTFEQHKDCAGSAMPKVHDESSPFREPEAKDRHARPDTPHFESAQQEPNDGQFAKDITITAVDASKVDYGKLLMFEFSAHAASRAPTYRSRRSSSHESYTSLPPYPGSPSCPPEVDIGKHAKMLPLELISEAENEETQTAATLADLQQAAEVKTEFINIPFFPQYRLSRGIPGTFTEQELYQIRRESRHIIRVVTRTCIGLPSSLALAGVAPQLLIAAAINAYCLHRGIQELREQLEFLEDNELSIKKRDVAVAILQGALVKIAFMAITINHDDFVVLASHIFGSHANGLTEVLHQHPVPGFRKLNEVFIKPIEHVQEHLGIPTMAERAAHAGSAGIGGGWLDHESLMSNILLVGGIQAVMELIIDRVHEHLGGAARSMKSTFRRKTLSEKTQRQETRSGELEHKHVVHAQSGQSRGCHDKAPGQEVVL